MKADEIYNFLKTRILSGKLEDGQPCPSENYLHDRFGASRGTIRRALQRLTLEGLLDPPRQGTHRVVRNRAPLEIPRLSPAAQRRRQSVGEVLKELGKAEGWEPYDQLLVGPFRLACGEIRDEARINERAAADTLELTPDDPVWYFKRARFARDAPVLIQSAIVNAKWVETVEPEDLRPGGVTRCYRRWQVERSRARAEYAPTLASREEASVLRVATGAPCIEERRISFFRPRANAKEVPFEHLLTLYSDRLKLDFSWHD